MRVCRTCGTSENDTKFQPQRRVCYECQKRRNREHLRLDPDRNRRRAAWRADNPVRWWACAALRHAKARACEAGVPFSLVLDDVVATAPALCPALGLPLKYGPGPLTDLSPTIDRVDPALGYTPENTAVVSALANRVKSNATPTQIRAVLAYIEKSL